MADGAAGARARYEELLGKVDAFFARAAAHPDADLACRVGCDGCCRVRLSVTGIEAAAVADLARALPDDARRRLAARAARPAPDRCPALEPDGGCAIYAARPLVCRSHGLPIRLRDGRGLPVVESCPLNWRAGAANAPPAAILDQETLSTVLLALDAAHAAAQGRPAGARVDLAALLAEALSGDVPAPVSGPRR